MFKTNAIDRTLRDRHRACVAMWVGGNEGDPPKELNDAILAVIAQCDPTRSYVPQSASPGTAGHGPYLLQGDGPRWYFQNAPSKPEWERGLPNIPAYESTIRFLTPAHDWPPDDVWGMHYWCRRGNMGVGSWNDYIQKHYGGADSLPEFVRKSQLVGYESHKALWEGPMARGGGGMLNWMTGPSYPCFVWQTYDYYYDTPAAYWGAAKTCQPINAIFDSDLNCITVVNKGPVDIAQLDVGMIVYNVAGDVILTKNARVAAPSKS
jgi:hypothetical protein